MRSAKCGHDNTAPMNPDEQRKERFVGWLCAMLAEPRRLRSAPEGRLKVFLRTPITVLTAIFYLALLAGCGPTAETAHREGPRHDEARRDEPRRDDRHLDESKSGREGGGRPNASYTATPGHPHDLSVDEAQGGHTLSRHVGRSDADLQERLQREGNISAASTYTNRETAEAVVGSVLGHDPGIERWRDRDGRRPNLALDYHGDASQPIGRCMQRGSAVAVPASDAIVVLKETRYGGFYVLTTYPECPR